MPELALPELVLELLPLPFPELAFPELVLELLALPELAFELPELPLLLPELAFGLPELLVEEELVEDELLGSPLDVLAPPALVDGSPPLADEEPVGVEAPDGF